MNSIENITREPGEVKTDRNDTRPAGAVGSDPGEDIRGTTDRLAGPGALSWP